MATQDPIMVVAWGKTFDFGRSRLLESAFLSMWFGSVNQCNMVCFWSFFLNLKEQTYLVLPFYRAKNKCQSLMLPRNFEAISSIFTQAQYCEYSQS